MKNFLTNILDEIILENKSYDELLKLKKWYH